MIEGGVVRWSVAQIISKRGLAIQDDVHRSGFQTYLPMMRWKRFVDGKESNTARPAMPGYMFICGAAGNFYTPDGRSVIARLIGALPDGEYERVRADNADGKHDILAPSPADPAPVRRKVRRRRPRPGKRQRVAMKAERAVG